LKEVVWTGGKWGFMSSVDWNLRDFSLSFFSDKSSISSSAFAELIRFLCFDSAANDGTKAAVAV
jgi:hypothetical protein